MKYQRKSYKSNRSGNKRPGSYKPRKTQLNYSKYSSSRKKSFQKKSQGNGMQKSFQRPQRGGGGGGFQRDSSFMNALKFGAGSMAMRSAGHAVHSLFGAPKDMKQFRFDRYGNAHVVSKSWGRGLYEGTRDLVNTGLDYLIPAGTGETIKMGAQYAYDKLGVPILASGLQYGPTAAKVIAAGYVAKKVYDSGIIGNIPEMQQVQIARRVLSGNEIGQGISSLTNTIGNMSGGIIDIAKGAVNALSKIRENSYDRDIKQRENDIRRDKNMENLLRLQPSGNLSQSARQLTPFELMMRQARGSQSINPNYGNNGGNSSGSGPGGNGSGPGPRRVDPDDDNPLVPPPPGPIQPPPPQRPVDNDEGAQKYISDKRNHPDGWDTNGVWHWTGDGHPSHPGHLNQHVIRNWSSTHDEL